MNQLMKQLADIRSPFEKKIALAKNALDKITAQNTKTVAAAGEKLTKTTKSAKAEYEAIRQNAETTQAKAAEELRLAQEELKSFEKEASSILLTGNAPARTNGASTHKQAKKTAIKAATKQKATKASAKPAKKAAKTGASSRALKGRDEVESGKRPPLTGGIRLILGKKTMKTSEIAAEVKRLGWTPNSTNPGPYISQVMSAHAHGPNAIFEQVKVKGRGHYRVRIGAKQLDPKVREMFGHLVASSDEPAKEPAKKTAAKQPAAKAAPAKKTATKAVAKPATKAATKAAPKAKPGKGQQRCSVCFMLGNVVFGHNAKGHDKWLASQGTSTKAAPKAPAKKAAATKTAAKAAPVAETPSTKASSETTATPETVKAAAPPAGFKTADELLASGSEPEKKADTLMEEGAAAFGGGEAATNA